LADATAGDRGGLDANDGFAAATRPRLDAELGELLQLCGVVDELGAPADEHAPPFAHRLVDVVGFEADGGACRRCERAFGAGVEDDVAVDEAEVDR